MGELFTGKYSEAEARGMPALALAHIGDCVFELLARSCALDKGAARVGVLHRRTVMMVSAEAQAEAARAMRPQLSEEELGVFMRGRNAKPHHAPPHKMNAEIYPLATALEALFGYLYLTGCEDRIAELWKTAKETMEKG